MNPQKSKDKKTGYVKCSSIQVTEKIAAITECWERLITEKKTPTLTAMSLILHRVTGSKEATRMYHRAGFGTAYTDIRTLTNSWADCISMRHKNMLPEGFKKKRSVHVTFDNSDGKQQTITGDHTTHHTTGTIFQAKFADDIDESPAAVERIENDVKKRVNENIDFGYYKIPKAKRRQSPKQYPQFTDEYSKSTLIENSLYKDIAWVLVGYLGKSFLKESDDSPTDKEL